MPSISSRLIIFFFCFHDPNNFYCQSLRSVLLLFVCNASSGFVLQQEFFSRCFPSLCFLDFFFSSCAVFGTFFKLFVLFDYTRLHHRSDVALWIAMTYSRLIFFVSSTFNQCSIRGGDYSLQFFFFDSSFCGVCFVSFRIFIICFLVRPSSLAFKSLEDHTFTGFSLGIFSQHYSLASY